MRTDFIERQTDAARFQFQTSNYANRQLFRVMPPRTIGALATLQGRPIVWGATSSDRGGYRVRLAPRSAKITDDAMALFNHNDDDGPLATRRSNTLRIEKRDPIGISVEIDLPDTTLGRDVFELVRTKRVTAMSFAMVQAPWSYSQDGRPQAIPGRSRILVENGITIVEALDFWSDEVSVVTSPAFAETSIDVAPDQDNGAGGRGDGYSRTPIRDAHEAQLRRFRLDEEKRRFESMKLAPPRP